MATSRRSSPSKRPAGKADRTYERRSFADAAAWERWLDRHHATSPGIWIVLTKKGAGPNHIVYDEVLGAALCYGWIDGQRSSLDERSFLQKFTPRAKRSIWSKVNRAKALALIESGRMRPAGQAEVERAKADGRWAAAYDAQKVATVPDELNRLLAKNAKARRAFEALDSRNRYAMIFRIQSAKRPETRVRRAELFLEMLLNGERIHP